MKTKHFLCLLMLFCLSSGFIPSFGEEISKYPDFSETYLGKDKFENFNRKMFVFNGALNKYALRPVTVVWSSVMPKYGMDRIKYAYSNILYPRRLVSSLVQRDFKAAGRATARFMVNSTVGVAGMFDPAKRFLKIKPVNEDMEQALAKLKMKSGPYLVVPVISSATPRALLGRALDSALDPSSYVGSPVIAAVKAGFTINNAAISQPLTKILEQNYIDPYDIVKKMYGLQVAILNANLDRDEVIEEANKNSIEKELLDDVAYKKGLIEVSDIEEYLYGDEEKIASEEENKLISEEIIKGSAITDEILYGDDLIPDIILKNFNPQHPVIDSMRTALFDLDGVDESMWGEMSLWNRSFQNRIKTGSVSVFEDREKYKYRYIMQKDKNAPVAIIFPSVGESVNSHHSTLFAKLFYDEGYSVVIEGSAFHYDFAKSMPESFKPVIPIKDVEYIKMTTSKTFKELENKYDCKFKDKVVLGTSYGAMSTLFLADSEAKENSLNITKYISINPPVEILYAMNEIDTNSEEWNKNPDNLKEKTTLTAAKILNAAERKEEGQKIETLPFNLEEAKLITGFVLHQKLSDLLFAIENIPITRKTDFYEKIKNTNYKDYAQKYLVSSEHPTIEDFSNTASLHSIQDYLKNNNNYRIYHTLDDYLTNNDQLKKLKGYSKERMRLIDRGAHLGFLYREEFIDDFKKEISLKEKPEL
ncbi:MAG: VacJ family lipoprotein [bacterium]|nr:VacJ family lipoprotein [bacterium]